MGGRPPLHLHLHGWDLLGPGQLERWWRGASCKNCNSPPPHGVSPGRETQVPADPLFRGFSSPSSEGDQRVCGLVRGGSGSVPLPQSAGAQGCLCRKADSLPNFSPGPWGRGNRRAQPQRGWGAARAPPGAAGRGSRRCRTPALRAGELPGFAERPSGGSAPGKRKKETEDEGGQGETREAGDSESEQGRGRARAGTARAVSAPRQRTAPAGAECAPSLAAEVAGGEERRGPGAGCARVTFPEPG